MEYKDELYISLAPICLTAFIGKALTKKVSWQNLQFFLFKIMIKRCICAAQKCFSNTKSLLGFYNYENLKTVMDNHFSNTQQKVFLLQCFSMTDLSI